MCHEFDFVYPYICIIPSCKGRIEVGKLGLYDTHLFTKRSFAGRYTFSFFIIEIKSFASEHLEVLVVASLKALNIK